MSEPEFWWVFEVVEEPGRPIGWATATIAGMIKMVLQDDAPWPARVGFILRQRSHTDIRVYGEYPE